MHDINLEFDSGEMNGVMGGSRTGKSTLMGVLNGTISPDSSQILINGLDLANNADQVEGMIGYVPFSFCRIP